MCTFVGVLHHYIGIWAWVFSNVIWAAAFTYYICLDASWCSICVCLSSFWAWFWGFLTGIWAIPCTKKDTSTYVYLCWCSSSLHRYLSSLWALPWAFSNVIWVLLPLHTTYTSMHLDVLYVFVWAHFELDFEFSPLEFELSHAQKTYINICVPLLVFFITTSVFELTLSSVLGFFQCDLSCCLHILHIPWRPIHVRLSPFWAWFWAFPTGIWAVQRKTKCINIRVLLLMFFITTWIFEIILSSVLSFVQCDLSCCLYILHIPWCILMSYMCLFELILSLILSFPHWNLSFPMHKKMT